jgi:hypothetical protein
VSGAQPERKGLPETIMEISVAPKSGGDLREFEVTIRDGRGASRHVVTIAQEAHDRLAPQHSAEEIVTAAFKFLLDREPKESILARFDVSVISRYFPEFEREFARYLRQ